tara:strand:- start:2053 stop:3093 length:1041 start_codon:yes stop_codon:yes gene_type:complete
MLRKLKSKLIHNNIFYSYARKKSSGPKVLCYHGVEKKIKNKRIQKLHMPLRLFEKQIKYLKKEFQVISLDYLYECLKNNYKLSPNDVVITFDDGYKNNYNIVLPILSTMDIPFSVFVSTNHIGNDVIFPTTIIRMILYGTNLEQIELPSQSKKYKIGNFYEKDIFHKNIINLIKGSNIKKSNQIINDIRNLVTNDQWDELVNCYASELPMDWDDISNLNDHGVIIGAHSHNHALLNDYQSASYVNDQITKSLEMIKKKIGKCDYMCYPNGGFKDISKVAYSIVKDLFQLGFTLEHGEILKKLDKHLLPRIFASFDYNCFKLNLNNSHSFNKSYSGHYKKYMGDKHL